MSKPGHPPKFDSPQELQDLWDEYWEKCQNHTKEVATNSGKVVIVSDPIIPTVEMFAHHCDCVRDTLCDYQKKEEYIHTITRIKNFIYSFKLESLINNRGNYKGIIWDMAVNYKKSAVEESKVTHDGAIKLTINLSGDNVQSP